ncbi:MAG: sugar transferase [Anaerolineales bacterium]|nr:sugar transferase [Anaerolineales bacterium]
MIRVQPFKSRAGLQTQTMETPSVSAWFRNAVKRLFDIVMSLIGMILLAPVGIIIAILIKRDSPGPVFYRGLRAGKDGKPFKILKFRTMYERPESYAGPRVTARGDSRITPLGAWLRYTKINEFPQLWNVFVGEMSLVGPRPEDVEIAKAWPEDARREILSVRPGITSPASVLYHDEEKLLSSSNLMEDYFQSILPNKMRLDQLYVRYHSFFTDLDIIFWTIAILIPRITGTKIPEGYLFAGPFSRMARLHVNWFIADFLVALTAIEISSLLFKPLDAPFWSWRAILLLSFLLTFLFSTLNVLSGQNKVLWSRSTSEDGLGLLASGGFTLFLLLVLETFPPFMELIGVPVAHWGMVVLSCMLAQVGFVAVRYRLRLFSGLANRWLHWRQNQMTLGERVLIVGGGEGSQIAGWLLKRRMFRSAFSIVGVVDDSNPTLHGMRVGGYWMMGGFTDLPDLVDKYDVGVIVSTIPANNPKIDEYIFDFCRAYGIRLIFLDDLLRMVDKQVTQPVRAEAQEPIWRTDHLEYKAVHDLTTQLPNRYLLQDRLRHSLAYARRYQTHVALLFVDLEGLSDINNTLGRKYGDDILVQAAQRLSHCKRDSDTLARFGENQFALILENLAHLSETEIVARRIYSALSRPYQVNGHRFPLEPVLGVCTDRDCIDITNPDITLCYSNRTVLEIKQHEPILA